VLLAEQISQELDRRRAAPQEDGWHVARFQVLVRLDTPTVEVYEERRIVADRDGIDEITIGVSLPTTGTTEVNLRTEVRHGARLVRRERPLPHRSHLVIALPTPLRVGQTHDCGLLTQIGPGQPVRPHYVLTSTRRHDHFQLCVRFPLDHPPRWVRRVCGEPVRLLDTPRPTGDLLDLDAVGEVHTEFSRPTMYLAYGVQFWPPIHEP
jgi:hypothetical protein